MDALTPTVNASIIPLTLLAVQQVEMDALSAKLDKQAGIFRAVSTHAARGSLDGNDFVVFYFDHLEWPKKVYLFDEGRSEKEIAFKRRQREIFQHVAGFPAENLPEVKQARNKPKMDGQLRQIPPILIKSVPYESEDEERNAHSIDYNQVLPFWAYTTDDPNWKANARKKFERLGMSETLIGDLLDKGYGRCRAVLEYISMFMKY